MECLVLHAGAVVGQATLDSAPAAAAGASGSDAEPTWTGLLRPTPAYEPIRATCQAFTRLLTAAPHRPSSEAVDAVTGLPAGMGQMLEAIFAVRALDLQLATLEGARIPTTQVLVQDASAMRDALPPDQAPQVMPDDLVMVIAMLGDR